MCYYKRSNNLSFSEKYLIYEQNSPSVGPTLGKSVQDSFANIINAAARVVNIGADLLETGVQLLDGGVELTKDGVRALIEWHKDPGTPTELPEYDDLPKDFNFETDPNKTPKGPESVNDPALDKSIQYHLALAYLSYKSTKLVKFISPAMDEFRKVDSEIQKRTRMRSYARSQLDSVVSDITKNQAIFDSGHLLEKDPEYRIVETRLQSLRLQKNQLEQKLSPEVQWSNKPQYQTVEFPPKSGRLVQRFEVEKGTTCTINLEKYHEWLALYLGTYEQDLRRYKDEMEKLAYHRDLLAENQLKLLALKDVKDANTKFNAYKDRKKNINQKAKDLKNKVTFNPSGNPVPIVELETVAVNPTDTSATGETVDYEQNRKNFLQKLKERRKNFPAP